MDTEFIKLQRVMNMKGLLKMISMKEKVDSYYQKISTTLESGSREKGKEKAST